MHKLMYIYHTLRDHGFCDNRNDFSELWLGRSAGYLRYLGSSENTCCRVSLQLLTARLIQCIEELHLPQPSEDDLAKIEILRHLITISQELMESIAAERGRTIEWV